MGLAVHLAFHYDLSLPDVHLHTQREFLSVIRRHVEALQSTEETGRSAHSGSVPFSTPRTLPGPPETPLRPPPCKPDIPRLAHLVLVRSWLFLAPVIGPRPTHPTPELEPVAAGWSSLPAGVKRHPRWGKSRKASQPMAKALGQYAPHVPWWRLRYRRIVGDGARRRECSSERQEGAPRHPLPVWLAHDLTFSIRRGSSRVFVECVSTKKPRRSQVTRNGGQKEDQGTHLFSFIALPTRKEVRRLSRPLRHRPIQVSPSRISMDSVDRATSRSGFPGDRKTPQATRRRPTARRCRRRPDRRVPAQKRVSVRLDPAP